MLPVVVHGDFQITCRRQALVVVRRWLAEARRCFATVSGRGYRRLWRWSPIGRHSILGRFHSNWLTFAGLYRHVGGFLGTDA